jgi:H+/gluconate symporter-like permease
MPSNDLLTNIIYPTIVVLGTTLIIFICSLIYNKIKKRKKEIKPEESNKNHILSETQKASILIETKETANIYRATKTNNSYLSFYVMFVNTDTDIIVIRDIKAIMSDEIGIFQKNKKTILGTHKGLGANYVLGNTENFLPISITGNTSIDAYILFEFSNANIEIGSVLLKVSTSKGETLIPLSVDVIG